MEEEDLINVGTSPKDKLKLNAYLQNTGKVKNEVDPKYNKIKLSTSQYLQNTSIGKSKYDENLNFGDLDQLNIDESVNEHRAQEESNLAKIGAGIGRIGTKAVSEIVKMPGVIGGIIAAPFAEEGKGWETAFNNQWIKSISQFNEDINAELLPVYVKKAVSEGNLWDNISSIDFWATEGADGIGFIASMFAPGAALKSLNLGSKIMGTTAKGLSMVNGEAKLAGAVRTLEGLGINANKIDMAGITMANTLFESGSEAGSAMDSFQKDIDKKLASGEINQQQYEQLQTQKGKLGRDIFVSNLAILLVPNAIQTKMIWGKGLGSQLVKDTPSLIAKIGNRSKNVLGALGSEGFLEEGSQSTVETMFSDKAKRGELTDNMSQDFNISELVSSYIDTLNTTEGQKAIFLGGFLGGGMSAYQGGKSDIATRKETQDILTLAEEKVGIFNRINETDPYKRDDNGDIVYNYNNKPQYDPVKIRDIAKSLNYTEEQSQLFDQAIQEGNEQVVQTLKNQAINQLITPFINKGELGIQALSQYLDTTLKTEEIAENEDAKSLKGKILEQATYMQDQLNTYKDFSKSLINLNNPKAKPQDTIDYYNMLGDLYTNLKGSEYFQKGELKKLNVQKSKLLKDLGDNDITKEINTNFTEGTTEDIYKFKKSETDPRVKLLNDQIETVEKGLSEIDEIINGVIWNNEDVNKQFAKHIEANNKLREQASPENEAIVNQATETIANATEPEELNNLPKTNTPADKVVQQKSNEKKVELKVAKEVKESGIISNAKEDDEAFNGTSKTQTYSTEGSKIYDELTPKTSENTTKEEDDEGNKPDATNGWGTKLISYDRNTGEAIWFVDKFFSKGLEFERNPVNKIGNPVGFEINENPGTSNGNVTEALKQFKEGNFQNIQLLIDYLPINIKLAEGTYLPIETRRLLYEKYVPGKPLKLVYDKDGNTVPGKMNLETGMLRKSLITSLINGVSIENMNSTITGQYKGVLQVESPTAENSLLDLSGVDGLKYIKDNTYFVNIHGQLENVLTGQTRAFQAKFTKDLNRTKDYAAGEIYLMVPQADGVSQFPLKLNISKLSIEESEGLFEIYKEILTQDKGSNTTLSEVSPELLSVIENIFGEQLKIITTPSKIKDIKLGEIIDLLVHESDKPKSRINVTDGVLYFGENGTANSGNIDELKEEIMYFLHTQKRHQIKIRPKTAEDNQRTNLSSNSANYIKYLVEGKILSTNAVVNEPLFQGYTNLFINPIVTIKTSTIADKKADIEKRRQEELTIWGQTEQDESVTGEEMDNQKAAINAKYDAELKTLEKSTTKVKEYTETEIEDRLKGVRTVKELAEGFKTLSKEQQDLYKPLFTEKRIQIEDKGKVKVSDAGAQIASNNFEGLDFGDNQIVTQSITGLSITYTPTGKKTQTYTINKNKIINSKDEEVFKEDSADRRKIFANVAIKEGRAKVIEDNKGIKYVVNNKQQIMSTTTGKIMEWAENHATRKLLLDKYNKLFENNLNNTRNVENNSVSLPESTTVIEDLSDSNKFVSSSDIPNTVENKQQVEKQNEVFKEPKGLEGQKDTKTITLLKDKVEKGTATEANLKQLEDLKNKYGEEYVKKCK